MMFEYIIRGVNEMKRYFSLLFSILILSGFILACAPGVDDAGAENSSAEINDTTEEESDESTGNDASAESLGIELRSHDFDEADEDISDFNEEEKYFFKEGQNLTLPEDFPSDFPIANGMSADSVKVGQPGFIHGDNTEVWFNDGNNYDVEQLYALYEDYINNSGFDEIEIKDQSVYLTGL